MFIKKEVYEYGETTGICLAQKIRAKKAYQNIQAIRDPRGVLVYEPQEILEVFHAFYSDLHWEEGTAEPPEGLGLPLLPWECLNAMDSEILEAPFTKDELELALNNMALGKAAGPDKLPVEVYKVFFQTLGEDLLATMQTARLGLAPRSWQEANIVILKKKGRQLKIQVLIDPSLWLIVMENYMRKCWPIGWHQLLPLLYRFVSTGLSLAGEQSIILIESLLSSTSRR